MNSSPIAVAIFIRAMFPSLTAVGRRRWVEEDTIVTSVGISASLDLSLHLVERLAGRELALRTARPTDFAWHEND